ncbi:hypothetical protein ACQEVF_25120 [Nonomuraea polychroma]|uniref:hypothetical protein n=1 Tax=Nonomuraea polychroma TaxID=46176 RepID=UPI003D8B0463
MTRLDKPSFWLGVCVINFLWTAYDLITTEDVRTIEFAVNLAFAVTFAVVAVWIAGELRKTRPAATVAHIDTEGVYAAVRCSGCGAHLLYLEHGHDLSRLTSARDSHECTAPAETGGAQ